MKKQPKEIIPLTSEQKRELATRLISYLEEELETDCSQLQSQLFLDYITKHLGVVYYNQGVMDAMSFMTEKAEDLYLILKDVPEGS